MPYRVNTFRSVVSKASALVVDGLRALRNRLPSVLSEPQPLRTHLLLLVFATALPLLIFGIALLLHFAGQRRLQDEQRLSQTVIGIAADIDRQIGAMAVTLRTLATSRLLADGRIEDFAARANRALGEKLSLTLYDQDGLKLLDTSLPAFGVRIRNVPPVQDTGLTVGTPQVSDLMYHAVGQPPFLQVRLPLTEHGQPRFTIAMRFSPDLLRDILVAQQLPAGWVAGVSDSRHIVLARSALHERYLGTQLPADLVAHHNEARVFSATNLEGVQVYRAVKTLTSADWLIATTVPKTVIGAAAQNVLGNLLLIGLAVLAASGLLAALLSRRIAGHIAVLADPDGRKPAAGRMQPVPLGPVREINTVARVLATEEQRRSEHEASIEQQRSFLSLVLTAVPSIVYIYDLAARRTRFSTGAMNTVLGYSPAEIEGLDQPLDLLVHPDDLAAVATHQEVLQGLTGDASRTIEYRMRHRNGSWHWLMSIDRPWRRDHLGRLVEILGVAVDITDRKAMEADLALHATVTKAAHDALIALDLDGRIEAWNPGAERLFGYTREEAIGAPVEMLSDAAQAADQAAMLKSVMNGRTIGPLDTERRRSDGSAVAVSLSMSPVVGADGKVCGVVKAAQDISERKRLERRQALLARELVHRSKNQLAVISSIVRATLRSSPDPAEFATALTGRLQSFAAAQDILVSQHWERAELKDIAEAQLQAHADPELGRVTLSGPPVMLPADLAVPVGLALHELATNASKYGALSVPQGRVEVDWTITPVDGGGRLLTLHWRESGGPPVSTPTRRGFGSMLIERCIPNADVKRRFELAGLDCVMKLPLREQTAEGPASEFSAWPDAAQ